MVSLYIYICWKLYKKIDLILIWVQEIEDKLLFDFIVVLKDMKVDDDWKWMYLFVCLWLQVEQLEVFIDWFSGFIEDELEIIFGWYFFFFLEDLSVYRNRMIYVLMEWNQ